MFWKSRPDSDKARAGFCAGIGPILHTAAGCPWYASAVLCLLLCAVDSCANPKPISGAVGIARELWNTLMAAAVLGWLCSYWPVFPPYAVAVSAVVLSLWINAKPASASMRAWGVAFYIIGALLTGVLVSAVGDMEAENLLPPFTPDMGAAAALGLLLAFRLGGGKVCFGAAPVCSAISVGVLGVGIMLPFYELSRSIRFLGVAPRFEALCACAMTMSLLIGLTKLLNSEDVTAAPNWMKALKAVWSLTLWYLGVQLPPEILCVGLILLWVVPSLMGNRVEMKLCTGKNLKKRENKD